MKKIVNAFLIVISILVIMVLITGCEKKDEESDIGYAEVYVYIEDGLTESKIRNIEEDLKNIEGVNYITYTSKTEALEIAKEKLGKENEELLSQYTSTNHPFSASFTLRIRKDEKMDDVINDIKRKNGIKEVNVNELGIVTKNILTEYK